MQTVYYIVASIAAVLIIAATLRAMMLMERMERTRKDLATLLAESTLSLQHANRLLVRMQDSVERMRRAVDSIEKVLAFLQPSTAVGGILAGARRVFGGGRRESPDAPETSEKEANHG
ncbi:MAG: hypothetical protein ACYDCO_11225 [Armatimonadota bacterium]